MNDAPPKSGQSVSVNKRVEEDGLTVTLEEELETLLKGANLNSEKKKEIVTTVKRTVERYEAYQGPIPHPEHLAGYENVLSGSANRILSMAEKEQIHRQGLERRALSWSAFGDVFGQVSGLLVSFSFIAGAVYCAYIGASWVGAAMVGAGAAGIISALVRGGKKPVETRAPVEAKKAPAKRSRQRN